ncbi:MAG: hypothetical protein ACI9J3_002978, partial [Parvicellaceae bacterium]
PTVSGLVKNKERRNVNTVRNTAIVKGAGKSALNTLVYPS